MTTTATRCCASCGEAFTWKSGNPRHRFCSARCKARWWRAVRRDTTATGQPGPARQATATAGPAGLPAARATTSSTLMNGTAANSTADVVTRTYDPYTAGYGSDQPPSAVQNCPNCHQPVAVINLLVTPAAAYVNTPSRSVTDHS